MALFDYNILTEITAIAGATAAVYTNAASTTAYIRTIILHNSGVSTTEVELYNVPDNGGAVGTASPFLHMFYKDDVVSYDTVFIEIPAPGMVLADTNDTIQVGTTVTVEGGAGGPAGDFGHVTVQIFGGKE